MTNRVHKNASCRNMKALFRKMIVQYILDSCKEVDEEIKPECWRIRGQKYPLLQKGLALSGRIKPAAKLLSSQYFNVESILFQRWGLTLKYHCSEVKNETKSDIRFSTLWNVGATSVPNVETTLKQRCARSIQHCINAVLT